VSLGDLVNEAPRATDLRAVGSVLQSDDKRVWPCVTFLFRIPGEDEPRAITLLLTPMNLRAHRTMLFKAFDAAEVGHREARARVKRGDALGNGHA
jgi:hypothetical protein